MRWQRPLYLGLWSVVRASVRRLECDDSSQMGPDCVVCGVVLPTLWLANLICRFLLGQFRSPPARYVCICRAFAWSVVTKRSVSVSACVAELHRPPRLKPLRSVVVNISFFSIARAFSQSTSPALVRALMSPRKTHFCPPGDCAVHCAFQKRKMSITSGGT